MGKTTTTVALGGLLAQDNARVLLVDLDPHASLSTYLAVPENAQGAYELFRAAAAERALNPDEWVAPTRCERLYVMPASPALATLDRQFTGRRGIATVLARALQPLRQYYDAVLIDCPPTLSILLISAMAACDRVIIPVQTEFLALRGLERMLHTTGMICHSRSSPLPHLIVPTMFDRRTRASTDALQYLRQNHHAVLAPQVVPVDTQFREASRLGVPPSYIRPEPRGVSAYRALVETLRIDASVERQAVAG